MFKLNEWFEIDPYQIRIHELKDEMVSDSDKRGEKEARSVRLLVEYANQTAEPLKYSPYHWQLYDTEGYHYAQASYNGYYGSDVRRRLRDGVLTTGQIVKGWVAFNPPTEVDLSFVRFKPSNLTDKLADVGLYGSVPQKLAVAAVATVKETAADRPWWQRLWKKQEAEVDQAADILDTPIKQLVAGRRYKVLKPFEDFHGRMFVPGDLLTFIQGQPPYLGLHILEFKEATVHLHAENNADILGRLFDYLG
jgi:hypothetical protein